MRLRAAITAAASIGILAVASSPSSPAALSATAASPTVTRVSTSAPTVPLQAAGPAAKASYIDRLARAMNDTRRKHDLRPLKVRPCVDGFAARWSRHMAKTGNLVHQDLQPIMRHCGLQRVGEIIAYGDVSPRGMIRMWLNSPDHRHLLLDPSFRKAGVGAARGNSVWFGCIDFGRG